MKKLSILLILLMLNINMKAQIVAAAYNENDLYGFVDANNQWVIRPQYARADWNPYDKLGTFCNDGWFELLEQKKPYPQGLCDEWGKIIFPIGAYSDFGGNRFGDIDVEDMQGKKGVARRNGTWVIPCKYDHVSILTDDKYYYVYDKNKREGLWSREGKELVPCIYKNVYASKYGIEVTDKDDQKGLLTLDGKIWVECGRYCDFYISRDEDEIPYIEVKDEKGMYGLLTIEGKDWIPCRWCSIFIYDEYKYVLAKDSNGCMLFYSMSGTPITPCMKYEEAIRASGDDDILLMKRDGKWGYAANGKEVIPCIYDEATKFKNDVATVKKDGEVKLIKNPLKDASQIQIAENVAPSNKKKGGPVASRYPAPDSDVDKDIPSSKRQAENAFAFIIANENYPDAPVPYSLNDGRMFREYCQKALGIPEKNINLYEDATFGNIITAVEKMKSIAEAYEGDASVIFYYAGHGFPDDKQQTAYLLPIDGDASSITTTGYPLAKLYKEISELKLKSSIVFLDACFSGAKREDQMLASSRGVAIKVRDEAPQGNMVVFSAAQGDETAHQMEEKHHGLFTYFLLKELQATGGDVDMGTLTDYVTKQVKRQSVVINNKKQTPTVIPSQSLVNCWQTMKLK